ncbi:hypothetical protein N9W34_02525 [Rickettsiales bacterium]|nr:hypothetical protein [Rickettsiales bacterium]
MNEIQKLAILKKIVWSLAFILVGGSIFLFASVYKKFNDPEYSKSYKSYSCDYQSFDADIPAGVESFERKGRYLTILTRRKDNAQKIITIDLCDGETTNQISLNIVK